MSSRRDRVEPPAKGHGAGPVLVLVPLRRLAEVVDDVVLPRTPPKKLVELPAQGVEAPSTTRTGTVPRLLPGERGLAGTGPRRPEA
jgi:hypothetical protein